MTHDIDIPADNGARFHVVRVHAIQGIYDDDRYAYVVADHDHANKTVSEKFTTCQEAVEHANLLNFLAGEGAVSK